MKKAVITARPGTYLHHNVFIIKWIFRQQENFQTLFYLWKVSFSLTDFFFGHLTQFFIFFIIQDFFCLIQGFF